jgi:23S rRNA (guanosine2251-2'-O)-methyltransferase
MRSIVLLVHNIRSTHNVGSLFRTAEGFGIEHIYFSGYSPYPHAKHDIRLPHIAHAMTNKIHKTALGAELLVPFSYSESPPINQLKQEGYTIIGLEQDQGSVELSKFKAADKIALLLGEEVEGIETDLRSYCDALIEIPMHGKKESFNVSVAAGIALYALRQNN